MRSAVEATPNESGGFSKQEKRKDWGDKKKGGGGRREKLGDLHREETDRNYSSWKDGVSYRVTGFRKKEKRGAEISEMIGGELREGSSKGGPVPTG